MEILSMLHCVLALGECVLGVVNRKPRRKKTLAVSQSRMQTHTDDVETISPPARNRWC